MNEDLIKDSFCVEINKKIISKHILSLKITLSFSCLYLIMQGFLWFKLIAKSINVENLSPKEWYQMRILPIILILVFFASIASCIYYLQGTAKLRNSFFVNDAMMFNEGYKKLYTASLITAISFGISCLETLLYILLF